MLYQDNNRDFDKTLEQCCILLGKESPVQYREYDDEEKESDSEEEKEIKLKDQPHKPSKNDIIGKHI